MPSNKILSVLILCIAIVGATWIYKKTPDKVSKVKAEYEGETVVGVEVNPYQKIVSETNENWKNILTNIDPKKQTVTSLIKPGGDGFDETTITAQVSRELLSQYMLSKNDGELTEAEKAQIINSVSGSPLYNKTSGAIYFSNNLKLVENTLESLRKYKTDINYSLNSRSAQIKENPIVIVAKYLETDNKSILDKLDPIIAINKAGINDMLNMNVPKGKLQILHLELLNSISNTLSDLETLRQADNDPLRTLTVISVYNEHTKEFFTNLSELNKFLSGIK